MPDSLELPFLVRETGQMAHHRVACAVVKVKQGGGGRAPLHGGEPLGSVRGHSCQEAMCWGGSGQSSFSPLPALSEEETEVQ